MALVVWGYEMGEKFNQQLRVDYGWLSTLSDDETAYTLTEKQRSLILAYTEQMHWFSRWNPDNLTDTQMDGIDALVSDLEDRLMLAESAGTDTSPFWDDADGADADGSPSESDYTFQEHVEDWVIAAFVAASGVPGAAVTFLTIAPRFRLLFKRHDWGGIAKIFIDDEEVAVVDTYAASPDLLPVDIVIP